MVGVKPSTSCVQGQHPIHYARLSATVIASNGRVDLRLHATVYQDVMTCFKLHIIIFNINCVLMGHGFHSLRIHFQSQINISNESKFLLFASNEYVIV